MSKLDLSSKTVLELRKVAKDYGVPLGQGINKEGIIAKLEKAIAEAEAQPLDSVPSSAPAEGDDNGGIAQPIAPAASTQPTQYRAAWHNPAATPRYGTKPAYTANPRPTTSSWASAKPVPPQDQPPRIGGTVRPANYTPRFGPEASMQDGAQRPTDNYRDYNAQDAQRTPSYPDRRVSSPYEQPSGYDQRSTYEQRPQYDQRPAYDNKPPYDGRSQYDSRAQYDQRGTYDNRPQYEQRPQYDQPSYDAPYAANRTARYDQRTPYQQRRTNNYFNPELGTYNPAISDLLAAGDCQDGCGVLELHPDGYGFLRSDNFLPSSKDIYVSMAQIRRFGLRTGDRVSGKTRPQREGDKYVAMLYITDINGVAPDDLGVRPIYDELTPIYPSRRIHLECEEEPNATMRLVDLIAPLGFGQRGLILCPTNVDKSNLITDFANVLSKANPEAEVMVLLLDECPEDVTLYREKIHCPVLASTFDLPPEYHLRLADIVLERAERLVEQKKDVIILLDSLTRLSKTFTTAAAQQGRSMPGMVNPSSLFRAKKMFGAARCVKEGGSLTVIGVMNVGGGKVDDSVVEEFRDTANMELVLDASLARTGVNPPINMQLSRTKRAEILLTDEQRTDMQFLHSVLGNMQSAQAVPQLISMMDKAPTNAELLVKLHDWVNLMQGGKPVGNA